jgi:hypothetical protein
LVTIVGGLVLAMVVYVVHHHQLGRISLVRQSLLDCPPVRYVKSLVLFDLLLTNA